MRESIIRESDSKRDKKQRGKERRRRRVGRKGKRSIGMMIVNPVREIGSSIGKRMTVTRGERGKGVVASQTGKLRNLKQVQGKRVMEMTQIPKKRR